MATSSLAAAYMHGYQVKLSLRPSKCTALLATVVALLTTVLFGALLFDVIPHSTFTYDEADYAYAASQGIVANYLDSPSISLTDFVALGLANRGARMNTETRGKEGESLSEYIRDRDDITFYRHFHPPLYFYALSVAGEISGFDERALRLVSAIAVAITAGISGYFAFRLMGETGAGVGAAAAAGVVTLLFSASSPILIETGMTVTPHSLFSAVVVATLGFTGLFIASGRRLWWYATAVAMGFAFLTIEYAPVLVGSAVLPVILARREWQREIRSGSKRLMLEAAGIIVLVVCVLWLGGLAKLSIVKNYLFFTYLALVRARTSYGTTSLWEIWGERIAHSPQLLLATAALLFVVWWTIRRRKVASVLPFVFYVVLLFLINMWNHSPNPTYASSMIPALGVSFGMVAGMLTSWGGRVASGCVTLLVFLMPAVTGFLSWPPNIHAWLPFANGQDQLMAAFRDGKIALPNGDCLSVPAVLLPSIHYYAPSLVLRPYDPSAASIDYFGRCDYALVTTSQQYAAPSPAGPIVAELVIEGSSHYTVVSR